MAYFSLQVLVGGFPKKMDGNCLLDAGFRPGHRACYLARPEGRNLCCGGKGPKTIDAPFGHIGWGGREPLEGGPTRRARTRSAMDLSVSPVGRPAGGGQVEPLHLFCWLLALFLSSRNEDGSPITDVGDDEVEMVSLPPLTPPYKGGGRRMDARWEMLAGM